MSDLSLNTMFTALADPTRRQVVEALSRGPASVSELAQPFTMSLPAFVGHITVLEACGLIQTQKVGRVRTCYLQKTPLDELDQWVTQTRRYWDTRLDALAQYAEEMHTADRRGESNE